MRRYTARLKEVVCCIDGRDVDDRSHQVVSPDQHKFVRGPARKESM
jgi:hypothetical protein